VIIDEAHRSVYQKYRAIFDYFDSLLVGLTATPKDEIDRNTYGLFDLERGVPTDAYGLDEAVKDGFLVPVKAVSVPLRFQREGITYDQLSEDEQEQWDALEWNEEGDTPDRVDAAAVNKWLFNEDTVDKVLEHVMTRGQKVAGGDRLAKTIVFAENADHAKFIVKRFDINYPHHKGEFARVVTHRTEYVQSIIDDFAVKDRAPHIAASVDMLDTGIDIPEVANLVFFKLVRSKTKFWQMIGRGTRLCPDLFGPDQNKQFFYLFDYCGNIEFFKLKPDMSDGASAPPLSQRLFRARLTLIGALDQKLGGGAAYRAPEGELPRAAETKAAYAYATADVTEASLRQDTAELLRTQVTNMNVENFVVRPRRRLVEKYSEPVAWVAPGEEEFDELSREVSGLPTAKLDTDEEAKRFDLLMLRLQLALLRAEPGFVRLREQVRSLVGLLEEKSSIPMVRDQLALIEEVAGEEWWQDVTAPMLETARKGAAYQLRPDFVLGVEGRGWLARAEPPAYGIEDDEATVYDLLLWPDGAITRSDAGQLLPGSTQRIYVGVSGASCLGFLTLRQDGRIRLHEQPVAFIPFSTYDLGGLAAQSLCIRYTPPDRKNGQPQQVSPLAPRGMTLLHHAVRRPDEVFRLASANGTVTQELPVNAPPYGRLIATKLPPADCRLEAVNPPLSEHGA